MKISKFNELNPEEEQIIVHKGTKAPFSGDQIYRRSQNSKECNALCKFSFYKIY